ncbi:MAG: presenilin family intramembrane aspartyl protease [Chloroflexota bacterium]
MTGEPTPSNHARRTLSPLFWAVIIFVVAQYLNFCVSVQIKHYVAVNQITSPQFPLQFPLVYFFVTVAVIGIVLFLIPVSKIKIVFRILFAVLFAWGTFISFALILQIIVSAIAAVIAGSVWFFQPRIWLHNLLLVLTLASGVSLFGFLLSPWTAIALMLVLAIYDFLAVRFGYMVWMARKLSESETLPAFFIPFSLSDWNLDLRKIGAGLFDEAPAEREFSVLGGGDIGFPLLLVASVFFASGFTQSLAVAVFALLGLIGAFLIQRLFLKGKPMPALPPIAFASLIGFVIVSYLL